MRGGCGLIYREACTPRTASCRTRRAPATWHPYPSTLSFFDRFSRAVLGVFRNSKWVMQHIVGNLSMSSFQRYKVYANRSSDERVMAPGSRGVGAVLCTFPMKILVKREVLLANREFHVVAVVVTFQCTQARRSTCCESERLCARRRLSGRKNAFYSQRVFSQILSQFVRVFDLVPDVGF